MESVKFESAADMDPADVTKIWTQEMSLKHITLERVPRRKSQFQSQKAKEREEATVNVKQRNDLIRSRIESKFVCLKNPSYNLLKMKKKLDRLGRASDENI